MAVRPGDRVVYAGGPPGSYAEARVLPADILGPIPEGVTDRTAATAMLKGMTTPLPDTSPSGCIATWKAAALSARL
jgi:hypothetical protein